MAPCAEPLIATVSRDEREDRWFRRVVLRQHTRRRVLFSGHIHSFDFNVSGDGIANSTVVVRDPTEALSQVLFRR